MNTVIFENDNAIFRFVLADVLDLLTCYSSKHQVEEATYLLEKLKSMPGDLRVVPVHHWLQRFKHIEILGTERS